MKVIYDWLQEYVGSEMPPLSECENILTFHSFEIDDIERVGEHDVIDVKILPDRSSDCLSHRGIAHEIGALIGKPLVHDPFRIPVSLTPSIDSLKISISPDAHCRRFALARIEGVTIKTSPDWLIERLSVLGQRAVNNVVDATNYVMLALGQPLHAYDAEKFSHTDSVWQFGIRMAHDGETLTTLSNETITLKDSVQLIVDAQIDMPVGIAGIKGGKSTEIDDSTTHIIIESANFDPVVTRRAAQLVRIQTDAVKRFENNLSPDVVPYALVEVVDLIQKIAGGTCIGYADMYPHPCVNQTVHVSREYISALLGVVISDIEIESILDRLAFSQVRTGDGWDVVAPFERTDVTIPEDVIADIGRVYGYDAVPAVTPERMVVKEYNARHFYSEYIRGFLQKEGFSEIISSSFRKKDILTLHNALADDKKCLRSSLHDILKESLDKNIVYIDLLGITAVQIFEIGTVFTKTPDNTDVAEHIALAIGVRTKQRGYTHGDDVVLTELQERLENALGTKLHAKIHEGVLECNLSTLFPRLLHPTVYTSFYEGFSGTFCPYSLYPFISRDISLWIPFGTRTLDVEGIIREHAGTLLTRVTLFDEFTKEDKVSVAFRLIFQSTERTLTDAEVGITMEKVTHELQKQGFEVR